MAVRYGVSKQRTFLIRPLVGYCSGSVNLLRLVSYLDKKAVEQAFVANE